ncbi:nitrite transporter NirC [Arcanobacterium wilhelmae]|uniref:Nitrite transporter NirC n=1 Tax=Arcanobacterium wilhelmae TaxID=1803177 RepID=A0ABT9N8L6_9ACTO|nr:formate/nitrite transporter family protein [Arcanobacterium wilhelmae]MDP9800049.1 nitrite transporter NirC [Arcanobacterium wilhelmae]WFN89544.1 formate/nitrite transporter family protein [Arcanobacterium wilhelmae]
MSITESIATQAKVGLAKSNKAHHVGGYLTGGALAGAFVGIGCLIMFAGVAKLYVAGSAVSGLMMGLTFGIGLVLVVFAGGELATSGMMIMPLAALKRAVSVARASWLILFMLIGNLVGSIVMAALFTFANVFGNDSPNWQMLDAVVAGKLAKGAPEVFFRAVMCNVMVCLAIWTIGRMKNEVAQIIVIAWAITVFVAAGFEHVVANMTIFSLALMNDAGGATFANVALALLLAGLGNLVGGMVVVGGTFALASTMEE